MLIVTGMPGSGKDEFIKVAKKLGWADYHMGDTVRTYAAKNDIGTSDKEIGSFANRERELYGKDIWAVRLTESIKDGRKVIIDGLRNMEEYNYFKSRFPDLVLIAIHTDRDERMKRIKRRGRPDDAQYLDQLISRDDRELSWGIGNAISLAEYMIVNDSTLEDFKKNAETLLKRIEKERYS
ncbi:MAG: AAA family ATPase [Cuniculiplasma sp.]